MCVCVLAAFIAK